MTAEWLTREVAAGMLGVSPGDVAALIENGQLTEQVTPHGRCLDPDQVEAPAGAAR